MNSYVFLCRIKWPVMIVVFGITALLNQWNVLSYGESWPLYLIAWGLLMLAERAAWSRLSYSDRYPGPPSGYSGTNWQGPSGTSGPSATPPPPPPSSSTALSIPRWEEGRK